MARNILTSTEFMQHLVELSLGVAVIILHAEEAIYRPFRGTTAAERVPWVDCVQGICKYCHRAVYYRCKGYRVGPTIEGGSGGGHSLLVQEFYNIRSIPSSKGILTRSLPYLCVLLLHVLLLYPPEKWGNSNQHMQ